MLGSEHRTKKNTLTGVRRIWRGIRLYFPEALGTNPRCRHISGKCVPGTMAVLWSLSRPFRFWQWTDNPTDATRAKPSGKQGTIVYFVWMFTSCLVVARSVFYMSCDISKYLLFLYMPSETSGKTVGKGEWSASFDLSNFRNQIIKTFLEFSMILDGLTGRVLRSTCQWSTFS